MAGVVLPLATLATYAILRNQGDDPVVAIQRKWRQRRKRNKAVVTMQRFFRGYDVRRDWLGQNLAFLLDPAALNQLWTHPG
jgi:hypothetical protein